jgi:hypothetical protein
LLYGAGFFKVGASLVMLFNGVHCAAWDKDKERCKKDVRKIQER